MALDSLVIQHNQHRLALGFLAGSTAIRSLSLEQCTDLRDADTIAGCGSLRHLTLRECGGLRIDQRFLARLSELRTLAVESAALEPRNLLRGQPHLQRLELSAIGSYFHSLDQLGIRSALSTLTLTRCPGLRRLAGIEDLPLRTLSVVGCPNLESLGWLGALDGLRNLRIKNIDHLYDDDYDFLRELSSLETLTLENCGAGKLEVLRSAPRLRRLTLINTGDLPDLDTLTSLPHLRDVRLNLAQHLGPDADRYIAILQREGIEVTVDDLEFDEAWSSLEFDQNGDWDPLALQYRSEDEWYLPTRER